MANNNLKNPFAEEFNAHLNRDISSDLFDQEPCSLEPFLYDLHFLRLNIKLSPRQFEVLTYSTQIYRPETLALLKWTPVRYVNELYLQWGKGSGKDLISMITAARIAYLLMCLKDPQGYFQAPSFSNIDMINMALNAEQAKFNYYEPMRKMIMRSRFFKNRAEDREKHIKFEKNIYAHSGHSDEEAAEGKNLILAVLDEISGFKTRQEFARSVQKYRAPKYSFESLIDAMKTSRQSRFDTGKLMAISFPRYKGCPIQQLYNAGLNDYRSLGENSKVFVSFGATWEINPTKSKKQFEAELLKNPALVKAKYMCEPSQAEDSFIRDFEIIESAFPDKDPSILQHTLSDYPQLTVKQARHSFATSIHIDLGLNNCRAGFCMTHQYDRKIQNILNDSTGVEEIIELPMVAIDIITSFQAPSNGEIDFSEIRKFIFSLKSVGYHIGVISYDQWNSAGERQILEKAGFNVVRRSVDQDRSMYDDLVIMMQERRLTGGYAAYQPMMFAGAQTKQCIIKEELQGLVEIYGKKIAHRPGGTKDQADALAGSVRGAIEFGVWRCGESGESPTGNQLPPPTRQMDLFEADGPLLTRLKSTDPANQLLPQQILFRGDPKFHGH